MIETEETGEENLGVLFNKRGFLGEEESDNGFWFFGGML